MKSKFDKAKAIAKSVVKTVLASPLIAVIFASLAINLGKPVRALCVRIIRKIDGK